MKKFFLSIVVVFLTVNVAVARVRTLRDPIDVKGAVFLKITPSSILDPHGSRLPVGAEYFFADHWSTSAEFSIPFLNHPLKTLGSQYNSRIRGDIRLRLDIRRFYTLTKRNGNGLYIGIEGFWRNQELIQDKGGSYYGMGSEITVHYYKRAELYKNIFGGGMFFGGSIRLGNRIHLEPYIGMGLRTFHAHRRNVEGLYESYNKISFNFGGGENRTEGQGGGLYIPLGLKISVKL